jgi:UDP-glucose 4-epimerase
VTGSEGFIGRHLVNSLKGFEILRFDRLIKEELDVTRREPVLDFFRDSNPDIVIHLAGKASPQESFRNPQSDLTCNVLGTINVLEASALSGVNYFVLFSSAQVYGDPEYLPIDELHPVHPNSPYGAAKSAAENYCRILLGPRSCVIRLFNSYGAGQSPQFVVPSLVRKMRDATSSIKMLGNREDTRDFVHVNDVCDAMARIVERKPCGETINIGSGIQTRIYDVAKEIAEMIGKKIEFSYPDQSKPATYFQASIEKARRLLGWQPRITLNEGLKTTIAQV